jgi:hypothetical protein
MKIKPQIVITIILVILAAGVGYAALSGTWATNSSNGNGSGEGNGSGGGNGIRGSSTFAEISSQYEIPEEDMMYAFGVEDMDASTVTPSNLTELYPDAEIGTGSVRLFVALYLGEEYDLTGDANLLDSGVQMLLERGTLTVEQEKYLELHTVQEQ